MLDNHNLKTTIQTPKHTLNILCSYDTFPTQKVKVNKKLFKQMCKNGCPNYNQKFGCPPLSPSFKDVVKEKELFLLAMVLKLNQFNKHNYQEYLKIRIANSVLKSRIEKVMRKLEKVTRTKFLSTGACRLCKPCQKKISNPCKHPDKRRYSLESLGVDCNHLTKNAFGLPLKWYKKKKAPEYTTVICGLPIKESNNIQKIINLTEEELKKL
jgi:predicted metal-binding protein